MKSVRKQWVLDVQWSDAPQDVIEEVIALWQEYPLLCNDDCIYKFDDEDWADDTAYPAIRTWLLANHVPAGEEVWIHWWW